MTTVFAAGIDLSGPSNPRKTCVVVLRCRKNTAEFVQSLPVAGDSEIYALIADLLRETPLVVGLDAPLAASGAALAAWAWSRKQSVWLAAPEPPFHPFPFAC